MKNIVKNAKIAAIGLFLSSAIYAQRPVWLLGHRCNSMNMIQYALDDGANGVEIDVQCGPTEGKHWCVSHNHFVAEAKCDDRNWMSLKTLLKKDLILNDSRFCLLFLDVKDPKYIKELVEYVHAVCNNPKFYILYGLNLKTIHEDIPFADVEWLVQNLNDHEGFCSQSDTELDKIEKRLIDVENSLASKGIHKSAVSKFCYVYGRCLSAFASWNSIRKAAPLKKSNRLCVRSGCWTCQSAKDAYACYKDDAGGDFAVVECRGWSATHMWRRATRNTYNKYINTTKYGLMLAKREHNFWSNYWSGK